MRNLPVWIIVAMLIVCAGCETRMGDFTALSTKNIYCTNIDVTKLPQTRSSGTDITFLGIGADLKDAADDALEKAGCNLMIDGAYYHVSYPLFEGYKVVGTVVNVPYSKKSVSVLP